MENISSRRLNFEFGFNDANFSDRLLHIEIIDDSFDSKPDSDGCRNKDSESCKVKSFHINSLLLAANSPFFEKLFKNGMRESKQTDTTLKISSSEEAGVMELLNFMYCNTLIATSIPDVLGVLVVADKFEAPDCVRYCCEFLQNMPVMTLESALVYLELPSSVLMREEVHPLMDAAKEYLLTRYKDINKSQEEVMTLPLSAFVVLLGSDRLLVDLSGDNAFEMMLKWARAQYPELDKRREIIAKNLTQFIPFRRMSSSKLKEVLVCPDVDREQVSKLMLEALIMVAEDHYTSHKYPVIKVEQYGTPQPQCIVYFDLKKEDCESLLSSSRLNSQSFRLGGRLFYLSAQHCTKGQRPSFGLFVCMDKGSQSCSVDFEFEAMSKSSLKFQNKGRVLKPISYSDSLLSWGFADLFGIPWTDFMSSEYFIHGILHLRANLTISDSEA